MLVNLVEDISTEHNIQAEVSLLLAYFSQIFNRKLEQKAEQKDKIWRVMKKLEM